MKEVFEQWTKMSEKIWDPWKQSMDMPWNLIKPEQIAKGSSLCAAMRSSLDINAAWWKTFMDQWEEIFFKTLRESQFYSNPIEDQLRGLWDLASKTQKSQVEIVKEQLEKMEKLLKEQEDSLQRQ